MINSKHIHPSLQFLTHVLFYFIAPWSHERIILNDKSNLHKTNLHLGKLILFFFNGKIDFIAKKIIFHKLTI